MIQYQILRSNIRRVESQTVRRITNEILGVKGLNWLETNGWVFSTHICVENREHVVSTTCSFLIKK